jgi:hypothetical protein
MHITELTTADGHQITLFGRQNGIVPVDNVESTGRLHQDIAGVDVGMAQDIFQSLQNN